MNEPAKVITEIGAADDANGRLAEALPVEAGSASPEGVVKLAAERMEELGRMVTGLDADAPMGVEYVHDLRVLTRRVTEIWRLFAKLVEKPVSVGVAESLGKLRKAAGELRDLDVMGEHLERWRWPAELRKIVLEILGRIPARRVQLEEQLRFVVKGGGVQGMLFLLTRAVAEAQRSERIWLAEKALQGELVKLLRKRRRAMEKKCGRAAKKQTDTALHEARITIKKLRYMLEIGATTGMAGAKRAVRVLKGMQELLGAHHDVAVINAMLEAEVQGHGEDMSRKPTERRRRATAWRKWKGQAQRQQARRAADFFVETYLWKNSGLKEVGGGARKAKVETRLIRKTPQM